MFVESVASSVLAQIPIDSNSILYGAEIEPAGVETML